MGDYEGSGNQKKFNHEMSECVRYGIEEFKKELAITEEKKDKANTIREEKDAKFKDRLFSVALALVGVSAISIGTLVFNMISDHLKIESNDTRLEKIEYKLTHGKSRSEPRINMINHRLTQIENDRLIQK